MKKYAIFFLLMLVSCPAWAGPLMDAAQAASKEPLQVITTPIPKKEKIKKSKTTQEEWQGFLDYKKQMEGEVMAAFGLGAIGQGTGLQWDCSYFNQKYPGSNMVCRGMTGTWVYGARKFILQNEKLIEFTDASDGFFVISVSYPSAMVRVSDSNNNFITLKIHPILKEGIVVDAKLQDVMQSASDVLPKDQDKQAFSIQSNYLITAINDFYIKTDNCTKGGMVDYIKWLIYSPEARKQVLDVVIDLATKKKSK